MNAINSTTLRGLFRGLEALYQTETGLDLAQLVAVHLQAVVRPPAGDEGPCRLRPTRALVAFRTAGAA